LKKLSAAQKRLKIEYLAKNGLYRPIEYVCVEIGAVPYSAKKRKTKNQDEDKKKCQHCIYLGERI
jgi:hypothetical protein